MPTSEEKPVGDAAMKFANIALKRREKLVGKQTFLKQCSSVVARQGKKILALHASVFELETIDIHSERFSMDNVLVKLKKNGYLNVVTKLNIYTYLSPCYNCMKKIEGFCAANPQIQVSLLYSQWSKLENRRYITGIIAKDHAEDLMARFAERIKKANGKIKITNAGTGNVIKMIAEEGHKEEVKDIVVQVQVQLPALADTSVASDATIPLASTRAASAVPPTVGLGTSTSTRSQY